MAHQRINQILDTMERHLLGKREQLQYAVTCLLAEGHLLLEDVPGVGKTTLAKTLANCINGEFSRVQFTSDLLPSDLIGVTVFIQGRSAFEFQKGPIFTNVLLADEINRANPKTQSALLEAMHDAHVSHDGVTDPLPSPYFVVATQNSQDHHGTFPLPESQLDRFLMKMHLGYPDAEMEKRVIAGNYEQQFDETPRMSLADLKDLQVAAQKVHVNEAVLDYIHRIMVRSRNHPNVKVGVSPRGGQGLYRACQALAFVRGRDYVTPDDVIELVPFVFPHRIMLKTNQLFKETLDPAASIFEEILAEEAAPE